MHIPPQPHGHQRLISAVRTLVSALCAALVLAAFPGVCQSEEPPSKRLPNIIFLLADDLGWTGLGCFGSDFYETPRIDALAESGMRFTAGYAACTVCSPTRASVMTGKYPARLRCTDFIAGQNRPFARLSIPNWTKYLSPKEVTLAEYLKTLGYRTGHIGKWHLEARRGSVPGTDARSQGFDLSVGKPANTRGYFINPRRNSSARTNDNDNSRQYLTDYLTDQACQFIESSGDNPYFLYMAYHVPHTPIQGRDDLVEYFNSKVDKNATHNNPVYAAMVSSLDSSVGKILDTLESSGRAEDTLVIFTSDNGGLTQRYGKHDGFTENLPLRRGKGSAYEGGVRVPAIVRLPGVTNPGSVCDTPVMTIDYLPTIIDIANESLPESRRVQLAEDVDGRSLAPLLSNPNAEWSRDLFWHYPHYHAGGDSPYAAVRSGDLRLIRFFEDERFELYDLSEDIGEEHNVALERPDQAHELRGKLDAWMRELNVQLPAPNPNFDPEKQTRVRANPGP